MSSLCQHDKNSWDCVIIVVFDHRHDQSHDIHYITSFTSINILPLSIAAVFPPSKDGPRFSLRSSRSSVKKKNSWNARSAVLQFAFDNLVTVSTHLSNNRLILEVLGPFRAWLFIWLPLCLDLRSGSENLTSCAGVTHSNEYWIMC